MTKAAVVTGITGQDGSYLARLLVEKGYTVHGMVRGNATPDLWRLEELGIAGEVRLIAVDLLDSATLERALELARPDEVYNLAAQSFVSVSHEKPLYTAEIDGMAVVRLIEAMRTVCPHTRLFQASSSEMFGRVQVVPQNEATPFLPRNPYGAAKLYAHMMARNYRDTYDLFCATGILYNHESPLRGPEFVTRKITRGLVRVMLGLEEVLCLGDLEARRDWGYAGEFVDAFWRMLQQPVADDYVIATGCTHSVRELVGLAADVLDIALEWHGDGVDEVGVDRCTGKTLVRVDPRFCRPSREEPLVGDPSKAWRELGWKASLPFPDLVGRMVKTDLTRELAGGEGRRPLRSVRAA